MTKENFAAVYMAGNKSTSAATKKTMVQSLNRIERLVGKPFELIEPKDFKGDNLSEAMASKYSLNTQVATTLAIIRYLDLASKPRLQSYYQQKLSNLVTTRNSVQLNQEQTEKEKENWVDYPALKAKVEEEVKTMLLVEDASFVAIRNLVLLALFTLQPPCRISNYIGMVKRKQSAIKTKLESLPKKHNYLVFDAESGAHTFVYNNYKTAKHIGQVVAPVEHPLLNELLKKFLAMGNGSKTLMVNKGGDAMNQTRFTAALNAVSKQRLGKELSNNAYRHIYITWFLQSNPPLNEKIRVLRLCGQVYKPNSADTYERLAAEDDAAALEEFEGNPAVLEMLPEPDAGALPVESE